MDWANFLSAKASLGGIIDGDIQSTPGSGRQFSLRTRTGKFFIKTTGPEQARVVDALTPGDRVYVVGSLHSFVSKRCRSHHVYVVATIIIPVKDIPERPS